MWLIGISSIYPSTASISTRSLFTIHSSRSIPAAITTFQFWQRGPLFTAKKLSDLPLNLMQFALRNDTQMWLDFVISSGLPCQWSSITQSSQFQTNTMETGYKVPICSRGNLLVLYVDILNNQPKITVVGALLKLLYKWFYSITGYFIGGF